MEEYIAVIKIFAGNFAMRGTAFCQGQILSIASNTALFSLIGTYYGGNGQTTFALPDLRGRIPVGVGNGPGLSTYEIGQTDGSITRTLTINQMPAHTHALGNINPGASSAAGTVNTAPNNVYANSGTKRNYNSVDDSLMGPLTVTVGQAGGGLPFSVEQSYLSMNYIIFLQGVYPARN
ncbi:phage tail protein [Spirosoma litoris]